MLLGPRTLASGLKYISKAPAFISPTRYLHMLFKIMDSLSCTFAFPRDIDESTFFRFGQGPSIETPYKLVHEAFSRRAEENPLTVAVEDERDQFTYEELNLKSTKLARKLIKLGLRPRSHVVLLVQRSIPMIVAIFAILKCGCQYIPLDGGVVSDDALAHILSESEPPFVLCLEKYSERSRRLAEVGTEIISLEKLLPAAIEFDVEIGNEVVIDPDDGVYVIYTSGQSVHET